MTASRLASLDEWLAIALVSSIFISAILTVAVMVVVISILIWQERLKGILDTVAGAYYLIAFCGVSLVVSMVNQNPLGAVISIAMAGFFIISLFMRTIMTRTLFERIIDISCIASLPGFFVILIQNLLFSGGLEYRAGSLFLNANFYATITELVAMLCIYRLIQPDCENRFRLALVLTANLAGLYLSNCRTAILALAGAVLVLLVLNRHYRTAGFSLAAIGGIAGLVKWIPAMLPRADQTGSDLVNRMSIWQAALKGILAHPWFGQGARTYPLIAAKYGGPVTYHAHSLYLDPLLNFGIVGVILLALYYQSNLRSIFQLQEEPQDSKRSFLLAAVLVSVLIHGTMDITVFSIQTGLLVSVLMAVAGIREVRPSHRHPFPVIALSETMNRSIIKIQEAISYGRNPADKPAQD